MIAVDNYSSNYIYSSKSTPYVLILVNLFVTCLL